MTKREFIRTYRDEIQAGINRVCGNEPSHKDNLKEIEMWLINDEGLYNWAKSEGVRV